MKTTLYRRPLLLLIVVVVVIVVAFVGFVDVFVGHRFVGCRRRVFRRRHHRCARRRPVLGRPLSRPRCCRYRHRLQELSIAPSSTLARKHRSGGKRSGQIRGASAYERHSNS